MTVRDLGGVERRKKRVLLSAGSVAELIKAFTEAAGFEIAADRFGPVDLLVLETADLDNVIRAKRLGAKAILVIVPRRLRESERRRFEEAGAAGVVDEEASILDLAFAFSDLLFDSTNEQRRYMKSLGGLFVSFLCPMTSQKTTGRLLGLATSGGFVEFVKSPVPGRTNDSDGSEGARIELSLHINDQLSVPILGRIAGLGADGFGVEFALEEPCCAPKLYSLSSGGSPRAARRSSLAPAFSA